MSLLIQFLFGLYLGVLTGIIPAMVAWVLGFLFKYFTGVSVPALGVMVLAVAIAGVQGGLMGLIDPEVVQIPAFLVATVVVMMMAMYSHSQGDKMGAEFPRRITIKKIRDSKLSHDVIERIGKFGQVRIQIVGEIKDIEGYPPLPEHLRESIKTDEWLFPADIPVSELENRFVNRLIKEYDLSDVSVNIDGEGRAEISAAPPLGGLSRRVPEGKRAVSVNAIVPTGLARGDEVTLKTAEKDIQGTVLSAKSGDKKDTKEVDTKDTATDKKEEDKVPEKKVSSTTTGGEGRVTVSVSRPDLRILLSNDVQRLTVNSRGTRREYELISLLKKSGKQFRKLVVSKDSFFDKKTIGEVNIRDNYSVVILAVKKPNSKIIAPRGSISIEAGDELFVAGMRDKLIKFEEDV